MDSYFRARDILDKAMGTDSYFQIKSILFGLKAADVVEVKHGKWIFDHMTGNWSYYAHCSECGLKKHFENEEAEQKKKYCPSCGALMREIENGEK